MRQFEKAERKNSNRSILCFSPYFISLRQLYLSISLLSLVLSWFLRLFFSPPIQLCIFRRRPEQASRENFITFAPSYLITPSLTPRNLSNSLRSLLSLFFFILPTLLFFHDIISNIFLTAIKALELNHGFPKLSSSYLQPHDLFLTISSWRSLPHDLFL